MLLVDSNSTPNKQKDEKWADLYNATWPGLNFILAAGAYISFSTASIYNSIG